MPVDVTVPKVWFITGASRGFGREWTVAALQRGDRVAAAARSARSLTDLQERFGDALLLLDLDISDRAAAFAAVAHADEHFGRLDVLVNNAGYGMFGMVEETSEQEARRQLDTNFFGTLWVTQAALPVMRAHGSGHIIQTSSVVGVTASAGLGLYTASKWALEGFTQALALEVAAFGIKVTLVEPAGYATDQGSTGGGNLATPMPVYSDLRANVLAAARAQSWGDPKATCAAILALADSAEPPLRIFLGEGLIDMMSAEYTARLETWREWESVSVAAAGT